MSPFLRLPLATLVSAAVPLCGQVFIVDATGGAGSHFTDLPAAVAAVPDGATLRVRAGSYNAFVLDGKGLAIVGEGTTTVSLGSVFLPTPIVVRRTGPGQAVLIKGLTLDCFLTQSSVEVQQTAGPVVFHAVHARGDGIGFALDRCANVLFHDCPLAPGTYAFGPSRRATVHAVDSTVELSHCDVRGHDQPRPSLVSGYPGDPGGTALSLVRSRGVLVSSTVTGGLGSPGCNYARPIGCGVATAGAGGKGADADASTLVVIASTISGNRGWDEWLDIQGPVRASDGGDGLTLRNASRATVLASNLVGGPGGIPNGRAGAPSVVNAGSTLLIDATARPTRAELLGTQARGQIIEFVARGAPLSPALFLLGDRADVVPLEPLASGSLLAAPTLVLGPFVLDSAGTLRSAVRLPPTWPIGQTWFAQALSAVPGPNTIWASNRVVLHVNH